MIFVTPITYTYTGTFQNVFDDGYHCMPLYLRPHSFTVFHKYKLATISISKFILMYVLDTTICEHVLVFFK